MPLYEYQCQQCGRRTEKIQKFSDAELTVCPHCGGTLERTITAPAVHFAGGGWYKDLYSSAKPTAAGEGKGGEGNTGEGKSGDAKTGDGNAGGSKAGGSDTPASSGGSSSGEGASAPAAPAAAPSPAPAASSSKTDA